MSDKKTINIIVPVYNEEKNIAPFVESLKPILIALESQYIFEVLFVDDGSKDSTPQKLDEHTYKSPWFKYIQFTRNFGKERATSAGLHYATGDAAIILDVDGQHPTELLPRFIEQWEQGSVMIVGVRQATKEKNFFRKLSSDLFYKILNRIGDIQVVPNATDFRLVDRTIIEEFNKMTERNRITRGLLDWLGFPTTYLYFTAEERRFGKPVYSKLKLLKLAMTTFVAHSLFPLKLAGYLGMIITLFSGILGLAILLGKYVFQVKYFMSFTGPAQLAILIVFLVGMILMALGLIALYIANIHGEVINRPMYVIKKKI